MDNNEHGCYGARLQQARRQIAEDIENICQARHTCEGYGQCKGDVSRCCIDCDRSVDMILVGAA